MPKWLTHTDCGGDRLLSLVNLCCYSYITDLLPNSNRLFCCGLILSMFHLCQTPFGTSSRFFLCPCCFYLITLQIYNLFCYIQTFLLPHIICTAAALQHVTWQTCATAQANMRSNSGGYSMARIYGYKKNPLEYRGDFKPNRTQLKCQR